MIITDRAEVRRIFWDVNAWQLQTVSRQDPTCCQEVVEVDGKSAQCTQIAGHRTFHIGRFLPANDASRSLGDIIYDVIWGVG